MDTSPIRASTGDGEGMEGRFRNKRGSVRFEQSFSAGEHPGEIPPLLNFDPLLEPGDWERTESGHIGRKTSHDFVADHQRAILIPVRIGLGIDPFLFFFFKQRRPEIQNVDRRMLAHVLYELIKLGHWAWP